MDKEFTLAEARALVPHIRQLVEGARSDLSDLTAQLKEANEALLEAEWQLREERLSQGHSGAFSTDPRWKRAADKLKRVKAKLRARTQTWLGDIHETGALLRDLGKGLVDFPGRTGDTDIYWCWHLGEETVSHWHGRNEGFSGRKSVSNIPAAG